jgi:hypothetical protein
MTFDLHKSSSHYSWLDKFLHHVALSSTNVRRASFDLECSRYYSAKAQPAKLQKSDVLVCGLARSGTSLITRLIEDSKAFRSLTYQDMPFIMAPNFWKSLNGLHHRSVAPVERFHKDGLINAMDSPEAFESVFWETFRVEPIRNDVLENPTSIEALTAFRLFKSVVANPRRSGSPAGLAQRYLSKNNNNLMRLAELSGDKSNQLILVYRNPLSVARSLYEQHRFFSELHQRDAFSLKYMRWLAHHEFGSIHLPFAFAKPLMDLDLKPEFPNYWLDYWVAVHTHILKTCAQLNCKMLNFDRLCEAPAATIARLENEIDQKLPDDSHIKIAAKPKEESKFDYSSSLLLAAMTIFEKLEQSPKNI